MSYVQMASEQKRVSSSVSVDDGTVANGGNEPGSVHVIADTTATTNMIASIISGAKSSRPSLIGEGAGTSLYSLDRASLVNALEQLRIAARQQRIDVIYLSSILPMMGSSIDTETM
jgi:hypothetical protein